MSKLSVIKGTSPALPSLSALVADLHRAHAFWNARAWHGKLRPIETLAVPAAPNARRPCLYLRWTDPASNVQTGRIHVFGPVAVAAGTTATLLSYVHELVHQWEHEQGDPPSRGDHHSIEWHAEAARVGLVTEGRQGLTTAGPEFLAALAAFGPRTRIEPSTLTHPTASKARLWICGCKPAFRIRVARAGFAAVCSLCHKPFHPV